ncbi:MAG TPA: UMP kinase [Candidatus Korarchaeota archaeon]|nr:UMP kinase [Candidatus Korarchaeota archaeon]
MENFVLLLGGHVFRGIMEGDLSNVRKVSSVVRELVNEGIKIAIVTGGSEVARRYIEAVREVGGDNYTQDYAGILATRLHAVIMISALGALAYPKVVESYEEAAIAISMGKIPISGGIQPGQSTDAVASLIAEKLGFGLMVKMTGVDGVYDRDPKEYPDARKIEELTYDDLERIVMDKPYHPGRYELLDALSIKILRRSSISTIILSGDKPEALLELVRGKKVGSIIRLG